MSTKTILRSIIICWFFGQPFFVFSQLNINNSLTPQQIVNQVLVGNGVTTSNISFTGSNISIGKFSNGSNTNIGIDEGILITSGSVFNAVGPNNAPNKSTNTLGGSDIQLSSLVSGMPIFDATVLEFDFIPMSDTLKLEYVFASDEYPEWVGSLYNDVFGFFVSGPNPIGGNYSNINIAKIPNTNLPVTVNNINNGPFNTGPCTNCNYYNNNTNGLTIEYDGFTTIIKASLVVVPCVSYHVKIAIGDVGDHSYDSGIFLKSNSFSTNTVSASISYSNAQLNKAVEGCSNANVSFKLSHPLSYPKTVHYTVGGSATSGIDYSAIADSIIIPAFADSAFFTVNPMLDGILEGIETIMLVVETSACYTDTVIVNLSDYNPVSVNIAAVDSLCKNDSINLVANILNGALPYTYLWNTTDSLSSMSTILDSTFNFIVTVSDFCGYNSVDTHFVEVVSPPIISAIASSNSFCKGDSVSLSAIGATNYFWYESSGISISNTSTLSVSPSVSSTYHVIGSDNFGCSDTVSVPLVVKTLPQIAVNSSATQICIGDTVALTASGAMSYKWSNSNFLSADTLCHVDAFPNQTTNFTVVGVGTNGCSDSVSINLGVHLPPSLSFIPTSPEHCFGQSSGIQVMGAQTYSWSPANTLSSSIGNSVISSALVGTDYIVTGTNQWGCSTIDTISVIVNALPNVTLSSADTSICNNSSLPISAFGAQSYNWSPSTTLSASTGVSVVATPNSSIIYKVIGVDSNGCQDTTFSNITVSPNPFLTPANQTICYGDSAVLQATSVLSGTSYLWNTGCTNASIIVSPLASSIYSVTATDTLGCMGQAQATVTVNPLPNVSFSPNAPSICIGSSVNIQATGATSYQWTPSTGLLSNVGSTVVASPLVTTTYNVIAQNANGCKDTFQITVVVNPLPTVLASPFDSLVCINQPISLNVSGAINYSWSPATFLSTTVGSTVVATPTANINYIVSGMDVNGCINSDTVHLSVSPQISISAIPNRICIGDSTGISAISNTPANYLWSNGISSASFYAKPNLSTTFTVTATDTIGCTSTKSLTVIVDTLPIVSISPLNPDLCSGSFVNLTATGAINYKWYPALGLNNITGSNVKASPLVNTLYAVIGTNSHGCSDTSFTNINIIPSPVVLVSPSTDTLCFGDSISLIASGALNYQWFPANGLSTNLGAIVNATPSHSENYKIIGTALNGCTDSAFANLVVKALPNLVVSVDSVDLCIGQSVNILASGANNYQWSPAVGISSATSNSVAINPNSTTTYKLLGSTTFGCLDSMEVYVGVHPFPNVSINPINPHLCPGDSLLISASGADTYSWNPSMGLSSNNQDTLFAFPSQTTQYQVIGSTVFGCADTAVSTISVSPIPTISPSNPSICVGDSVQLTVTSNTASSIFLWSTGDSTSSIWVKPTNTINFSVTATNASGCSKSTSKQVIVNQLPILTLNPTHPGICPGDTAMLTANGANSYNWLPSNGLLHSSGSSNSAFPSATTTYKIVGQTLSGCVDTLDFQVVVFASPIISVNPLNDTICGGQFINLIAQGALNYQWTPIASLNSAINDTVVALPTVNTSYTVVGYDANGCTDTAVSTIKVYSAPIISVSKSAICVGDSSVLSITNSLAPDSILWNTGAITSSIIVKPLTTANYNVNAYFPGGCVKNSSKTITVHNDPAVIGSTLKYTVCHGDTIDLYGSQAASYLWSSNSTGLQNTSGTHVKALISQNTIFSVQGTSIHGCKSMDTVSINTFSQPVVSAAVTDTLVCVNDTVSLFGTGAVNYLWSNGNILNYNNINHVIATIDTSRAFILTGTDQNGCSAKDTVNVKVDFGPTVFINPSNPILCQGDTTLLTASGATNYLWSPNVWISGINTSQVQIYPNSNIYYNVRGYNTNGCFSDANVYINVKRNPVLWVSPSLDSICQGDSIQIMATGAGGNGTYVWTPTAGLNSNQGAIIWASPTVNTTYQITGISTDGCSKSISSTIKVHPKPTLNITTNTNQICLNDSIVLTATGAVNYNWNHYNVLNSNTLATVIAKPQANTLFTATGTNLFGCSDSAHFQIIVNSLPTVHITSNDSVLCYGDSTLLNANGASVYQWTALSGLAQNIGATVIANPLVNMNYTVQGTDSNGCVDSDSLFLVVNPNPIIGISSSAVHICSGNQIQLIGQSNMNPTFFIWNSTDTMNVLTDNPNQTTQYSLHGINQFGCHDSTSISVQVNPYPVASLNVPDTVICLNDSLILNGISTINPVSFLWNTAASNTNIHVSPQILTHYSLIVSDSIGCSDTVGINVDVQQLPSVSISTSKEPSCAGDSVYLLATGSPVAGYQWSNAKITAGIWENPTFNTAFSVIAIDSLGCRSNDTLMQYVNQIPQVVISPSPTAICMGDTINLTATSNINPVFFVWSNNLTTSSIVDNPALTNTYTVTAHDSIGCSSSANRMITVNNLPILTLTPSVSEMCKGDTINLIIASVPAGQSYIWSHGCIKNKTIISPLVTTNISVIVTDINNCKNSISRLITVNDNPVVNISQNATSICSGDTVIFVANSNHPIASSYWNTGDTTQTIQSSPHLSQNYITLLADSNGCLGRDTAHLTVIPRPNVNISSLRNVICTEDSALIKYTGTATNNAIFNWNYAGANISSIYGNQSHWLKWNSPGFYTVSLTATENGCTSYPDTAGVQVYQTPIIDFVASPTEACESLLVFFENRTPNLKTFHWDFGNPFNAMDTSSLENPDYAYPITGSYTVGLYAVSNEGCPAYGYKSGFINVHENPKADFGGYPIEASILNPNISFWDFSDGAIGWQYNFGDLASGINNLSTDKYPWHNYTDTGHFQVQLVVTNIHGCTDTAYNEIYIKPFPQIYYPNAFTPNGDGLNDIFEIKGHDFNWSTFEFVVFDRWGKVIYQTSDVSQGWNGKINNVGEECPAGNYVFIVKVKDKERQAETFKGNILLVK